MIANEQNRWIIVKIGGSVLTRPDGSLDRSRIVSIYGELSAHRGRMAIVHGTGARGRAVLRRHQLTTDFIPRDNGAGVRDFRVVVSSLKEEIVGILASFGVQCDTHVPHELFRSRGGRIYDAPAAPTIGHLASARIAVFHGDALEDDEHGYYIASGDEIAAHLAASLRPSQMVFLTSADGVYDTYPPARDALPLDSVDASFLALPMPAYVVGEPEMAGKVRQAIAAAGYSDQCHIVSGERIGVLRHLLTEGVLPRGFGTLVIPGTKI